MQYRRPIQRMPDRGGALLCCPPSCSEHAVLPIDSDHGKTNSWHSEVIFVNRLPAISVLRARITLAGDIPRSIEGVPSTPRSGDASHYSVV